MGRHSGIGNIIEVFRKQIRKVMGGTHPLIVVTALIVAVTVSLVASATWDVLGWLAGGTVSESDRQRWLIVYGAAAMLTLLVWLGGRSYTQAERIETKRTDNVAPRESLILFLSQLNGDRFDLVDQLLDLAEAGRNRRELLHRSGKRLPWRMPLEAMDHHCSTLRRVLILPSRESAGQIELFCALVTGLFPECKIKILSAGDLQRAWAKGLDVYDENQLVHALDQAYNRLREMRAPGDKPPLIDITSGGRLMPAVGAIVALERGREFQYVSYVDADDGGGYYRIRTYDIQYQSDIA